MSRTTTETFHFRCDIPGCERSTSVEPSPAAFLVPWREANNCIRYWGWTIQGRSQHSQKHFCPDHKPRSGE